MAKNRPSLRKVNAVNPSLERLEEIQREVTTLKTRQQAIINRIRESCKDLVVVFIDIADSTRYKVEHKDAPETWIRRVYLFCKLITRYLAALNGKVVKYIGDEVMGVFDGSARVNDANSFVARVEQIEKDLRDVIGDEIRIKISVDKGAVSLLKFERHEETDPQGTPVDRCARIAKFAKAGTVLASFDFVKECPRTFNWTEVGEVELKGLGRTKVFQMGEVNVDLTQTRELREDEYQKLTQAYASAERRAEDLTLENKKLVEMNESLQEQLRSAGQEPSPEDSVVKDNGSKADPWDNIQADIEDLRKLIDEAPAPVNEYARFLFLNESEASDCYNVFERKFDACIEAKLVREIEDGYYRLDESHPRNRAVLKVIRRLTEKLELYEEDGNELFRYSVDDPDFWRNKIGYYVF